MHKPDLKIVSHTTADNTTSYIVQNGTKLGEFLKFLPAGIVNKTETGIGATTLELRSKRNSIIVEPLKVTASSKAKKTGAFYVGSPTKHHSTKVTDQDIKDYVNSSTGPKKFIVVADSLPRVIRAIGKDVFDEYFLMIDEVDAFQNDSIFRNSMELCLDTYFNFPKEQRALVSATQIGFSHPLLTDEHVTTIHYKDPTRRDIALLHTDNVAGAAYNTIIKLLTEYPNDKIAIAYNAVGMCCELADKLCLEGHALEDHVKILCSANNRKAAEVYFAELDTEALPGKITFLTSAYFNGFDLNEQYHLISVSDPKSPITTLSDKKLKQIAGRSRLGLLSEIIVYGGNDKHIPETVTKTELIEAAEEAIESLDCLERHFDRNDVLKASLKTMREMFVTNTHHMDHQLIRHNSHGKPQVSYFNIDACLEAARVSNSVYHTETALKSLLAKENNIVKFEKVKSKTRIRANNNKSLKQRKRDVKETIDFLRELKDRQELEEWKASGTVSEVQKDLVHVFKKLRKYFDKNRLLQELEAGFSNRDARQRNNFYFTAWFAALHEEHPVKQTVLRHIKIGEVLTDEQILQRLNSISSELPALPKVDNMRTAMRVVNQLFQVKRKRQSRKHANSTKSHSHEIVSFDPLNLLPTKTIGTTATFSPLDYDPNDPLEHFD
jgi:hypothetical protein